MWLRLSGCLSDAQNEKLTLQNSLLLRPGVFTTPLSHFSSLHIRKIFS
nr:toxin of the YeeV-YeeU toxin-antitoxin system [Escherichia coli]